MKINKFLLQLITVFGFLIVFSVSSYGAQEINVQGKNTNIADGDNSPTTTDDTDFGSANIGVGIVDHIFTIQNTGNQNLTIGTFTVTGDFSVSVAPAASVAVGGSTTFTVRFTPTGTGTRNGTISFVNNDTSENPYNFSIKGTGVDPYGSSHTRNFTSAYTTNINGNIKIVGNSVLTTSSGCTSLANNAVTAVNANMDPDQTIPTFNSTSADLILPAGITSAKIKYAGLYWQGRLQSGTLAANATQASTVKLKLPGSGYQTISTIPSKFNWWTGSGFADYQGIADITQSLKTNINTISPAVLASTGYAQTIWVADVLAYTGTTNLYGAWSLVIVYEDNTVSLKNLTVYDGYLGINTSNSETITLSGFLTPSAGAVNSSFFVFGGEGDIGYGDKITLTNKTGSDVSLGEVFTSSVTDESGANVTDRNPPCANTLGVDIHSYNIGTAGSPSIIGTGQSSTTVKMTSFTVNPPPSGSTVANSYDTYFPGIFAFATDIYQPFISIVKSTNSSGTVTPDQTITYTANITNTGNEGASNIVIYDNFDDNNLTKIDGNVTDPLVTLGDLLDHNTTTILDSVVCNYGPSHTDCKSSCSVGLNPFKIACSIPLMAVGETAYMQFQTKIASNPDTHGQSVKVENKMYATYYNALTGAAVDQTSSNLADAGQYLYAQNIPASGFDARETSIAEADNDRSITTKIVNKPFQLNVVSLDTGGAIAPYTVPTGNRVYLFPVDSSVCLLSDSEKLTTIASLSRSTYVDFANGDTTKPSPAIDLSNALLSAVAGRDKRIALNYVDWGTSFQAASFSCSNSNTQAVLLGVPQCLNADHKIGDVFGQLTQDVCAGGAAHGMNPALANPPCQSNSYNAGNLPSAPFDNAYGCYQCISGMAGKVSCSTDNFAVRPDRFVFTAPVDKMKAGEDYNLNVTAYDYNGNNAQGYNQSVSNFTGAPKSWWNRDTSAQIMTVNTQGITTITGDWNLTDGVGPVPIRYSDVGKFILDLNDSNWATVDTDDTILSDRTIQGDGNVTFIPFDFNISVGMIVNNDGTTPSFTYLSSDLNMSARIPMTIRAQNKQGALTQNYANNLFERSITITPHVASVVATARGLVPKTLGAANADANFVSGSTSIVFNDPLVARFNFSRDPRVAVSPFDVNSSNGVGNDVNVSVIDTDSVYGDKNRTLDGNATFVYGRLIPRDIRVFGNNPFTATAWYEVFNAPRINGTVLTPSRNESMWYINNLHNDATGGDANVSAVVTATNTVGLPLSPVSNGTGIETYPFAGETPPYSAKAHIAVSPWLWYGPAALTYTTPGTDCSTHPCFNINVVPSVGATGSSKDQNVGAKTNKSTSGGAGGWKSTRDYAPAIR